MKSSLDDPWLSGETFGSFLTRRGVSRRQFLSFCGKMALVIGAGAAAASTPRALAREIAANLSRSKRPSVVYLQLQECTGCLESVLRSGSTPVDELLLEQVALEYNELLMASSGDEANAILNRALDEPHLLIVNGSVPLEANGAYCTIAGESALHLLQRASAKATAILAMGACAEYGCVQAAAPNPTGAVGVAEVVGDRPVVNISGCPPIAEVMTAAVTYYLSYGRTPPLDRQGRPLFAYGQRIHDTCPRRASFDSGRFAGHFDDENARRGACLYHLGCKGPATFAPCANVEWNLGESFPIKAGHPCLGCTERHFFDRMSPFYRRLPGIPLPGTGVEASANAVGAAAVAASLGGVAVHAGATLIARRRAKKGRPQSLPLAVIGEKGAEESATKKPPETGDGSGA